MKRFTFYHLALAAMMVGLLYFAIFSVLSLAELNRLEKRVESLKAELNSARERHGQLARQVALMTNVDSAAVSLAQHGWKKSNEILVSIEPPVVAVNKPREAVFQSWYLWIILVLTVALAAFLYRRSILASRRVPKIEIIDKTPDAGADSTSPPDKTQGRSG